MRVTGRALDTARTAQKNGEGRSLRVTLSRKIDAYQLTLVAVNIIRISNIQHVICRAPYIRTFASLLYETGLHIAASLPLSAYFINRILSFVIGKSCRRAYAEEPEALCRASFYELRRCAQGMMRAYFTAVARSMNVYSFSITILFAIYATFRSPDAILRVASFRDAP